MFQKQCLNLTHGGGRVDALCSLTSGFLMTLLISVSTPIRQQTNLVIQEHCLSHPFQILPYTPQSLSMYHPLTLNFSFEFRVLSNAIVKFERPVPVPVISCFLQGDAERGVIRELRMHHLYLGWRHGQ
ncbi:hypothetical protein P3L10_033000 [Capsicum annuum]